MSFLRYLTGFIACFVVINVSYGRQSTADSSDINTGGLKFSSKDVFSSQRTSLRLFDSYRHAPKSFDLSFSCHIYDPMMYGFVFRAMHDFGNSQSPLIHLLYIPPQSNSNSCVFEFHFYHSENKISFELDTLHLTNIHFKIHGSVRDKLVTIKCNGIEKKMSFGFPKEMNINFMFGLFGENTDVAPMILQNVRLVLNDQSRFYWPLDELSGNKALEHVNMLESQVLNPTWLRDKHYYWEKILSVQTDPMAGILMDDKNKILLLNKDSLVIFDPERNAVNVQYYNTPRPFDRDAFFSIFNPKTKKIIAYDFHFLKVNDGRRVYSEYDRLSKTWTAVDSSTEMDQNHHHSAFWNRDTTKLILFGGYSYFLYYNTFKAFDFHTASWEELTFGGDEIFPRTHTSVSRNGYTGQYYLFGGFGNKEGSQSLEGRYFYDLYEIHPETKTVKKVWDMNSPGFEFVPRGNLIFRPDANVCYVLGNQPVENSNLRLYEINLKEPEINIVSDSIPVIFSDMSGNAFLFYNSKANELYCVTRETTNHPFAATTIFKLGFPPSSMDEEIAAAPRESKRGTLLIIIAVVTLILFFLLLKHKKHPIRKLQERFSGLEKFERKKHNAVWLLNEFKIFDKNGHDITYRFATKVRHAFFILFFENYFNNGILSADFSEILWPMLNKDQQKNNRGVIMNNLRKIFEDIGAINLFKDSQHWKLSYDSEVYIDFLEIHKILVSERNEETNETIINYFSLGSLVPNENWEYLDQYKERYSSAAIEILLELDRNAFAGHNYMKCIEISDIILNHFDYLNEPALIYKIKSLYILKNSSKAVSEYNKFRLRYNESISKNFHLSFEDIINMAHPLENY